MSTNFETEDKFPLSAILKQHPSLKSVAPRTLARWCQQRTRGAILESIRIGGRTMTSLAAVDRFLAVLNPRAADSDGSASTVRSPHERRSASDSAAQELARAGA